MKRWWLVMALMLSIGVNVGIFVSRWLPAKEAPPSTEVPESGQTAPEETGGGPREGAEEPPPRIRDGGPASRQIPRVIHRMADELGLEGEKRGRFVELQMQFLRQTFQTRQRIQRSERRLRQELMAETPNRPNVRESLDQMTRARAQMERAFVESVLETRELLDPEQTRKYLHLIGRLRQSSERLRQELQQRRGPRFQQPAFRRPEGRQRPPGGGGFDGRAEDGPAPQ